MAPPLARLMRRLRGALVPLAVLLPSPAPAQYVAGDGLARPHPPRPLGRWIGVLPARCGTARAPADVTLLLRTGTGLAPGGTYTMTEACRVPGLVPRVEHGTWVQLRDAAVVQLTVDGRLDTRSFLRLADGALRPLDRDLDPVTTEVLSPAP